MEFPWEGGGNLAAVKYHVKRQSLKTQSFHLSIGI
jgi:hypothetical protein